jgi:GMP synthase (glutamine-hydrolysing)
MPRRCLAIRHVAFEDLGILAPVLAGYGYAVEYRDAGVDELGDAAEADLLVVLGGPIGVYETDRYPFLATERALLAARLADCRPTLGICLGAQLIASAAGARVYPGPAKEIGWAPLLPTAAGRQSPLRHLEAAGWHALHWHGDTFDLPTGATLLASTTLVPHQAFSLGPAVLALQFHLEAEPKRLERWLIGHTVELGAAGIALADLRGATARHGEAVARAGAAVFGEWLAGLATA